MFRFRKFSIPSTERVLTGTFFLTITDRRSYCIDPVHRRFNKKQKPEEKKTDINCLLLQYLLTNSAFCLGIEHDILLFVFAVVGVDAVRRVALATAL